MYKGRLVIIIIFALLANMLSYAQSIANSRELIFSPDGNYLAGIGDAGFNYFQVWDSNTNDVLINQSPYMNSTTDVRDIDWSPDSSRVVIVSGDTYIRIWNVNNPQYAIGELIAEINVGRSLSAVEWSPDGQTIAVAGNISAPQLRFWDANTFIELESTSGSVNVNLMDWNSAHNVIATIYEDFNSPYVPWVMPGYNSTEPPYRLCPSECGSDYPRTLRWSHDGTTLAIGYV